MSEISELAVRSTGAPVGRAASGPTPPEAQALSNPEKAAVILGVLGSEMSGPIIEQFGEDMLRNFAHAMSRLRNIQPETVAKIIAEFRREIGRMDMTVWGGPTQAREMLQDYVNEATLGQIMDDIDSPSVHNVWKKLSKVDDTALAEFLAREHPQTVAVVLSKLSAEHAARILGRLEEERARDVVFGLTRTAGLDSRVVDAIGQSVSRDFLAKQTDKEPSFKPAERIGSIMNYAPGNVRNAVLAHLDQTEPEFAEEVKRKMFTFEDIPDRVERRDIAAIVRVTEPDVLLKALAGAADNAQEAREFILSSISSRVAEQIRGDLADLGKVKIREAEEAQSTMLKVIRDLESQGDLSLIPIEE